jgi:hypothetical protein
MTRLRSEACWVSDLRHDFPKHASDLRHTVPFFSISLLLFSKIEELKPMADSILERVRRHDEEQALLRQFVIPGTASSVHVNAVAGRIPLVRI